MIRFLFAFTFCIILSSCLTSKKVVRQVSKGYAYYPEVVAELSSKWFPVRTVSSIHTEYIKGNDSIVYLTDTVVYCNSVGQQIIVAKGKQLLRVDTFITKRIDSVENTAVIEVLKSQLLKSNTQLQEATLIQNNLEGKLKQSRSLNWKLGGGLALVVILSVLLLKFKIF